MRSPANARAVRALLDSGAVKIVGPAKWPADDRQWRYEAEYARAGKREASSSPDDVPCIAGMSYDELVRYTCKVLRVPYRAKSTPTATGAVCHCAPCTALRAPVLRPLHTMTHTQLADYAWRTLQATDDRSFGDDPDDVRETIEDGETPAPVATPASVPLIASDPYGCDW